MRNEVKGTPQGGVISPTLSNMTLDGLEEAIRRAVPRRSRVNFIRYADDFIITGKSRYLVVSSDAFSRIDTYLYEQLWRMLHRRHPHKTKGWLIRNYWTASGRKWTFAVRRKNEHGQWVVHALLRLFTVGITRYVKIKADANPYLPEYAAYFWNRRHNKGSKLLGALSAREYRAKAA